jgi:signal transduction histidine kinase
MNGDGYWSNEYNYTFTIRPPWWDTWWANTLFVLVFAGFIYALFQFRLNKIRMQHEIVLQQHKTSELEIESRQALLNERLRISRELHDDIGSTLGSISIYSDVAKKCTQINENTNEVLSKIGIVSRELIDKMSDIVWSLNPNHKSFEQLQNRMMTFAGMILAPQNIQYDFVADEDLKKIKLTPGQLKDLFLIFKEALYNIVKYANCKSASISLCVQRNNFSMIIEDDGMGFDVSSNTANKIPSSGNFSGGNGINNMKARADDMNAKLCINSEINKGTTVQLNLQL